MTSAASAPCRASRPGHPAKRARGAERDERAARARRPGRTKRAERDKRPKRAERANQASQANHIGERKPGRAAEAPLDARERARLLARLRRLTEPRLEERVARAHLPESERQEALSAAVEARVLAFIAEHDLFTPEEEALLRANSGPRFPEAARRLAAAKERDLREEARPERRERSSRPEADGARGDRR